MCVWGGGGGGGGGGDGWKVCVDGVYVRVGMVGIGEGVSR